MRSMLLVVVIVCTVFVHVSIPASAFHDGIRSCEDGEIGYLATMLAERGVSYLFLSSQEPPTTDTILCQITPQQLVQVKAKSQDL